MNCTIYRNIFSKDEPHYISVDKALDRIKTGASKILIEEVRGCMDKERANKLKLNLPSVCFSGKFKTRTDEGLILHSKFIVLDFDDVVDLRDFQTEIISKDYVYACWVSPRNNGLKALVKVASDKHRDHFNAILEDFPTADKSGVNESRVCYESYDPDIYINEKCKPFTRLKKVEKIESFETADTTKTISNILTWLSNRGDAFVSGERNLFTFKFASACCRFGVDQNETFAYCNNNFLANDNTFTRSECERTIKSAYKGNKAGTAVFENDKLVDKVTRGEVEINTDIYNLDIKPKDVIYGEDVKEQALKLYDNGYEAVQGVGNKELDEHFKLKRGEVTLITGIGNYGKSTFLKWYLILHAIKYGRKFALFPPEDNPAEEFYFDLVEIFLGCNLTPYGTDRKNRREFEMAYDWISKHFFYIYPKDSAPTPDYIKERFLEMIIKEKVDGCIIDPFNQLTNDYSTVGGRDDKYLEAVLGDFDRFATLNQVYFMIVAHPKMMHKDSQGNYPCPDVFDLSGGAMWNNKMYNILVYHRPNHQQDPNSPTCEVHTKKIKRQKIVGKKGTIELEYIRSKRRFYINQEDVLLSILRPITKVEEIEAPF